MTLNSYFISRLLLNQFHNSVSPQLLQCLPKPEAEAILSCELPATDNPLSSLLPITFFQNVHYSWLLPAIQKFPPSFRTVLLSALPERDANKLSSMMEISYQRRQLSESVRTFLLGKLYSSMESKCIIPPSFLPQTSMTPLSEWNKGQLMDLVDFLSLYDITEEVRLIIDKNFLKKLYACLDAKKKNFLRMCLHQKEKIASTTRLGLEKWDGDCEKLENMMHRRGLIRFGKALSGQHPDLIWTIVHRLDSGRGTILQQQCSSEAIEEITALLMQQVITVMNFLTNKESSE